MQLCHGTIVYAIKKQDIYCSDSKKRERGLGKGKGWLMKRILWVSEELRPKYREAESPITEMDFRNGNIEILEILEILEMEI